MTWQLVVSGFLIGTLVGLTGMGGGLLMTPLRETAVASRAVRNR